MLRPSKSIDHHRSRSNPSSSRRRRGVTLLFVISFIVLFLLMGTAFIVVATQFMSTSQQRTRLESDQTDRTTLIYKVLYDVLRGPDLDNQHSPLRAQSILADQYGFGAKGFVTAAWIDPATDPSRQFILLQIRSASPAGSANAVTDLLTNAEMPLAPASGAYDGLVFSFTENPPGVSGGVKGISTRILRYEIDGAGNGTFLISAKWTDSSVNPFANPAAELIGAQILINGREFNGTGAGQFDSTATKTSPALSSDALQPNQVGKDRATLIADYLSAVTGATPGTMFWRPAPPALSEYSQLGFVGGSPNESYDIADFQNMFLANGGTNPSFHRPDLAAYQRANGLPMNQVMFRPYFDPADPNSTGNADFPANDINGDGLPDYWDVDNDGDGVRDSVWIDIGLPVQYDLSGRRYRPLVAIRIEDLDGRLNLNAHGNLLDAEKSTSNFYVTPLALLNGGNNANLPRGLGLGPAEISLDPIFSTATDYEFLLAERYGIDGVPGGAGLDGWAAYQHFDTPGGGALANNIGSSFSTPSDIHGRFAYAFPDSAAFPTVMPGLDVSASGLAGDVRFLNESFNSAYEMSFATRPFSPNVDSPFTANELEALLRPYDKDSGAIVSRLTGLPGTASNALLLNRNSITTDSFEVPVAPGVFAENLYTRLTASAGMTQAQANAQVALMLSLDNARGMRFNLNRPFGNGQDSNADGIVDNQAESGTPALEIVAHPGGPVTLEPNTSNRIAFARQLFVLGFLVARPLEKDLNGDGMSSGAAAEDDIRFLAQWVANIVDFRDADSINFGFEYDVNPYNGWQVNGDLSNDEGGDRRVVWGSERPELLITEAGAFHDRSTEDRDDDSSGMDTGGGDDDYDSRLRPAAPGFIEIYNPWQNVDVTSNQRLPAEIYDVNGVDLDRATPGNGDPVWRVLVVKDFDTADATDAMDLDLDDPNATNLPSANDVERSIYFLQPPQAYNQGGYGDGRQYFTNLAVNSIGRGQYAVMGGFMYEPAGGGYRSIIGRRALAAEGDETTLQLSTTRGINLIPGAATGVSITAWNTSTSSMATTGYNSVGIVLNRVMQGGAPVDRSFSFSAPVDGYPAVAPSATSIDRPEYATPFDLPLDLDASVQTHAGDRAAINANGTTAKFRVIHLQRLANPLADWNANTNPYITQDKMYVDLVAFNGVISQTDATTEEGFGITGGNTRVKNMERGESENGSAFARRILWRTEPPLANPGADDIGVADGHHFNFPWVNSLGRINVAYTTPYDNPTVFTTPAPPANPIVPFPWLTWNNRPFASQLELANVPVHRNSQLLNNFTLARLAASVYQGNAGQSRFGHLPSLYGVRNVGGGPAGAGSDLHRLLEYLEVPSRFIGTTEYFNPANPVLPPYDRMSRYRDPGKLNLNTVELAGWNGLMKQYSNAGAAPTIAADPMTTRRSRGGIRLPLPTAFGSPFRAAHSANHVPPVVGAPANSLVRWDVDTGLFRVALPAPPVAIPTAAPAFDVAGVSGNNIAHHDWNRNPFFRHDARQKMGNNTTIRSSVFAIWITIGYFEVDSQGRLGAELGWDTGDTKRNRGFFIVDRSIPVAVEPGVNHNVEKAILVESFIE